jgi:Protein of unknown function (DUF3631)
VSSSTSASTKRSSTSPAAGSTLSGTGSRNAPDSTPAVSSQVATFDEFVSATTTVLDELAVFVRRFVVVSPEQADAVTLWIAHTFVFEAFDCSPYLVITSAAKRCGKSRLFDVLELLVAKPWRIVSPSEAVVYRKVARDHPTMLLDEVDTIFKRNGDGEPLRALLNAGNRAGTRVPRCAGAQKDKLEEFDVYCPKALAGIGKLPDTIADRGIPIEMKRRAPGEPFERFRRRDVEAEASTLRDRVADWTEPNLDHLKGLRPDLPAELDDRAQDAWEPLLAIADLAEGDWPYRARHAALGLSTGADADDDSTAVRLLTDVRRVFDRGAERLATADLISVLADDEDAPWGDWYGKPITPQALSKLLRPFRIQTMPVWVGGQTVRGYKREQFEDVWRRYLPDEGVRSVSGVRSGSNSHAVPNAPNAPNAPERDGLPVPGDPGYGDWIDQKFHDGHITEREWLPRRKLHADLQAAA